MTGFVTRFAPSPTGYLHLGHAYAALFAWMAARQSGGRFLLRLEDIDPARIREDFATAILEDLAWLGLDWDGPVRRQSAHLAEYRAALAKLDALGVLYPCFCSRRDIAQAAAAPQGDISLYPGTCRHLPPDHARQRCAAGEAHALRLDVAKAMALTGPLFFHERDLGRVAARPDRLGDVVLARRDAPASYHLCVTLDDHDQGVTLVTRGEDLREATHIHRQLQALLGLNVPDYAHHRLVTDEQGRRLAKRDHDLPCARCVRRGTMPAELRRRLGFPAGEAPADRL